MTTGKYSGAKYGTNITYGATSVTAGADLTWVLMIDWDDNGIHDGVNEAGRLLDAPMIRGNTHYLQPNGTGFEHMRGGRAILLLDNYDRRYDPRNSSSPLSPNVGPGKRVWIDVIINSTQAVHHYLSGVIDDIRPIGGAGGGDQVRIVVSDFMKTLWDTDCTKDGDKRFVNLDQAFKDVLADVQFVETVNIDDDAQPVPLLNVSKKNAGLVLGQLAEAGLGQFFCDKYGTAMYYGRNHSGYTNWSISQTQTLKDILVTQPWDHVANHVTAIANRPMIYQPAVLYFLPNPVELSNGVDIVIYPQYHESSSAQLGDYEARSRKKGGTDLTDQISIDAVLGMTEGVITVSPSADCWLTQLEIRGRTYDQVTEEFTAEDATSIGKYGIKKFKLDSPYLQDPAFAESFATTIKDILKDDREAVTIQIQQRPAVQFAIDLMHTVTFTSATLDLSDTYYITGYEHRWNEPTGQDVTTTIYLHKIITDSTSITPSDILEEIEVPLGYKSPSGDPVTVVTYPPLGEVVGPSYDFVKPIGGWYAGGGSSRYPENMLVWGSGPMPQAFEMDRGGIYFGSETGALEEDTGCTGFYIIPGGVTTVAIYPCLRSYDYGGGEVHCASIFQSGVVDYNGDAVGNYDNSITHTINFNIPRASMLGALGTYIYSVSPGESFEFMFYISWLSGVVAGFRMFFYGWFLKFN